MRFLVFILCVMSLPLWAEESVSLNSKYAVAGFSKPDGAIEYFAYKFQSAMVEKQLSYVFSMTCEEGFSVNKSGKNTPINTKQDFDTKKKWFFEKGFLKRIEKADYHNLFANFEGVMLGDGEVWFAPRASLMDKAMCVSVLNL